MSHKTKLIRPTTQHRGAYNISPYIHYLSVLILNQIIKQQVHLRKSFERPGTEPRISPYSGNHLTTTASL